MNTHAAREATTATPALPIEVAIEHAQPSDSGDLNAQTRDLRVRIQDALPSTIALRRELHAMPELSNQEHKTAARILQELRGLGISCASGYGRNGTGVLAHLPASGAGARQDASVALRADIDALPISERTGKPYSSTCEGVMHACGHDGHTAMLLGAARVLASMPVCPNPVTFLFQPAEESGGGAEVLCEQGALRGGGAGGMGAPVRVIYGLHGWPTVTLGTIATREGPLLAATDDFLVRVVGTQSHGAYPHFGNDPIVATAQIVLALQTIVSRNTGPHDACVVTVGAIKGGTADNIIPESVELIGTIRTLRPQTRAMAQRRFFEIVEQTARAGGCRAEITWMPGYPVTHNDPATTRELLSVARAALGEDRVEIVESPTMGGEDFAYFGQHVPSCFFLLGLRPAGVLTMPTLHQPDFDFNDDALATGMEMFCRLALRA